MPNHESASAAAFADADIKPVLLHCHRRSALVDTETWLLEVHRPFLFAIRDRASGLILFYGAVTDPVGTLL